MSSEWHQHRMRSSPSESALSSASSSSGMNVHSAPFKPRQQSFSGQDRQYPPQPRHSESAMYHHRNHRIYGLSGHPHAVRTPQPHAVSPVHPEKNLSPPQLSPLSASPSTASSSSSSAMSVSPFSHGMTPQALMAVLGSMAGATGTARNGRNATKNIQSPSSSSSAESPMFPNQFSPGHARILLKALKQAAQSTLSPTAMAAGKENAMGPSNGSPIHPRRLFHGSEDKNQSNPQMQPRKVHSPRSPSNPNHRPFLSSSSSSKSSLSSTLFQSGSSLTRKDLNDLKKVHDLNGQNKEMYLHLVNTYEHVWQYKEKITKMNQQNKELQASYEKQSRDMARRGNHLREIIRKNDQLVHDKSSLEDENDELQDRIEFLNKKLESMQSFHDEQETIKRCIETKLQSIINAKRGGEMMNEDESDDDDSENNREIKFDFSGGSSSSSSSSSMSSHKNWLMNEIDLEDHGKYDQMSLEERIEMIDLLKNQSKSHVDIHQKYRLAYEKLLIKYGILCELFHEYCGQIHVNVTETVASDHETFDKLKQFQMALQKKEMKLKKEWDQLEMTVNERVQERMDQMESLKMIQKPMKFIVQRDEQIQVALDSVNRELVSQKDRFFKENVCRSIVYSVLNRSLDLVHRHASEDRSFQMKSRMDSIIHENVSLKKRLIGQSNLLRISQDGLNRWKSKYVQVQKRLKQIHMINEMDLKSNSLEINEMNKEWKEKLESIQRDHAREMSGYSNEIGSMKLKMNEKMKENHSLQSINESQSMEILKLHGQIDQIRSKMISLENELNDRDSEIYQIRSEYSEKFERSQNKFQNELNEWIQKCNQLESSKNEMKSVMNQYDTNRDSFDREKHRLTKSLEMVHDKCREYKEKYHAIKYKLTQMQGEKRSMKSEIDSLKAKSNRLMAASSSMTPSPIKINPLSGPSSPPRTPRSPDRSHLTEYTLKIKSLERQLAQSLAMIKTLKNQRNKMVQQIDQHKSDKTELRVYIHRQSTEAQLKINLIKSRFLQMRQMTLTTYRALESEADFVNQNEILRGQWAFLRAKMNDYRQKFRNHA